MYKLSHELPKTVYGYYQPTLKRIEVQEKLEANLEGELVGEYELKRVFRVKVEIKTEEEK